MRTVSFGLLMLGIAVIATGVGFADDYPNYKCGSFTELCKDQNCVNYQTQLCNDGVTPFNYHNSTKYVVGGCVSPSMGDVCTSSTKQCTVDLYYSITGANCDAKHFSCSKTQSATHCTP
jgi:hypothetical protein